MDQWMKLFVLGAGSYGKVYYAVKFHSSSIFAEVAAVKCSDISRSSSLKLEAQILTTLKGCTMAEMMTGHRVWIDCSTKDLQWMIMNEDPMIPTNISEIAKDFLHKCFIRDPLGRWTSEQLLQHPFIQQALCTASMSLMSETRVNLFGCRIPIPEKDFISFPFEAV
ncbi:hypothetical protein CQW23_35550 [Capsicum baccatum]|uniref:Protein kinase domain-containing protein n=1 Tax=Capsicum baccatum TaxID=33114 RepID=A0A2G2UVN6_CAPBA|nr:hypothetical protein CQW23_35550 [Capsicum baccatum]